MAWHRSADVTEGEGPWRYSIWRFPDLYYVLQKVDVSLDKRPIKGQRSIASSIKWKWQTARQKVNNRKLEDQISPEDLNENVTRLTPQTPFFHRLPRPKIGKNRKPPSLVKPQYRTKKDGLPHLHKPLRSPPIVEIAETVGYISCLILCNGTLGVRGYFFPRLAK